MAVAFDSSNLRITDADSLSPSTPVAGAWTDIGGGGASLETDFFFQGSNSVSEQAKTSENGTAFVPTSATYNASGSNLLFLLKCIVTTSGLLQTTRANGQKIEIGSGGRRSAYYQWYLNTAATYPPTGGWLIHLFDVQEAAAFVDNTVSSPSLTAINYWGHCATSTGTVKSQNVALDAIEYIGKGFGLTWTGSGGTFQDFVDFDEGTTTNRYGIVTTKSGIIYCLAWITIGSATATTFDDSGGTIVFPWTYVAEGALGIKVDLQNASTDVDLSVYSFKGQGQVSTKRFFDTALDVNGTNEEITITAHGWETGDYVIYSKEGGSDAIGLTDATGYYVYVVDADTVELYNTKVNAYGGPSGTGEQGLTAATAPGENHSLVLDVDNRPDFTVSGTGGAFDADACVWDGIRVITFTSKCTLVGGFILGTGQVVLSTGSMDGVTVKTPTTAEGVALLTGLSTIANIDNCTFEGNGSSHAVEITSTGSTSSAGNTFDDSYWSPSPDGWNFDTITGIDSNIITTDAAHGFVDGDAAYYNNEGGSDTIGLTHGNKYYVNAPTTTTLTVHATKAAAVAGSSAITLSDGSTGETHSLYGAHAVVYNNSGGSVTITVTSGDVPSFRNGTGASTTATAGVTIEIKGVTEGARCVILQSSDDTQLLNDLAFTSDGAGGFKASTSFNYTIDTPVYVSAASSGKVVAGVANDTAVFTDETRAANDSRAGAGNTMTLIPAASPATPDAFYFGHTEKFSQMDLDILTAGVGTYTLAWEYWGGASWSAVSGLSDGTNNYKNSGSNRVSWTEPGSWATTTVTNQPGTTALYYIRARFVSGTVTTTPVGRCAQLDVTKYRRWETDSVITSTGLSIQATWLEDDTAEF